MPDVPNSPAKRLIVGGVLVVGVSVAASMLFTHLSFVEFGDLKYEGAMWAAAIVPLLVAPTAYGWVALLSWRLHKANAALDTLARRDALTGLHNRRAFVEAARARLAAGARVLLLIADIDHFKRINDSMGHAAGDLALVHAAGVLAKAAPAGSIVARIGGEEFALLVPAATDPAALVERIAAELAHMPVLAAPGLKRMTCSFGVAAAQSGEGLDSLLSRADAALYAAKDGGRDRMALAS
ncbi:GGDEF domain-containing protein [Sphingopyxis sp.]|jgi:diguanylate cyclase (GGDEF)-like protein|uniref:GGDEF domain-containing protein n=1 Tax=Sphingopyxis sp. TaxID=1908224 RepID=UPI0025E93D27|nr:GGDEF domain-containing protein [Sphingopyxis sp.]MBK6412622.1 GGDEF domain-containing protein [Sphingopyxis sp.]